MKNDMINEMLLKDFFRVYQLLAKVD